MKAAVVTQAGASPTYSDFREPQATAGMERVRVHAAALSNLTKARAAGSHYSADGGFPLVAGVDGVGFTADGRRVYFALPEAPFGALAEWSLVGSDQCVPVPDGLDDVAAAAIANPGMSAWTALVERAQLQHGETVLINGATGAAGIVAVQVAKYLGAGRIIVTGRNEAALHGLRALGADEVIAFRLDGAQPEGAEQYERALRQSFASGVNVIVDYLWGESAKQIIVAVAKSVEDATPVRFVHVGEASGKSTVDLPGAALRSSALQLMGSGLKSVPLARLLHGIQKTFELAATAGLTLPTREWPLREIADAWSAPGMPRAVVTMP